MIDVHWGLCLFIFVFVVCIFLNTLLSFQSFHPSLSGKYLRKYEINVTSCENNKNGSCPILMFNMLFYSKFNLFCKSVLSSIIMDHFQAIDSTYSWQLSRPKKCTLIFNNGLVFNEGTSSDKTGTGGRCSHGLWHLLLGGSVAFCFSECRVHSNITGDRVVGNTNRLLVFLRSQCRHRSESQKYKVEMQKITSLALGKYFSVNNVLFGFRNALSEIVFANTHL